jgi:hypothetical protein
MKRGSAFIACLALAIGASSMAEEFQPVEVGTSPLRERLAAVKSESLSLRGDLARAEPTVPEKAEIASRLAALEAEEKQLIAELESAKEQSRSPYITYAAPPSEKK